MAKKPSRYVDPQAPLDNNNLPITSYGSVDSTIPNFSKTYSETPRIADTGSASYVGDQYEPNSLDDQNVYQQDIPNLEDERASNQSTIGALGDATAKFLGKTVMSTVGNLVGTVYGVGAAIGEGKISDIWNNSFMDAVDSADKGLDNFFKVYKNADYKDQNILQKLYLHPTQFTDEATDTASFMAGAILSEIATSGLASETIVPKALKYMKYLSEGAEAAEATKALTSNLTKGINIAADFGTTVKHLAMGASYEGIVEARQATMELREKMYSDYEKEHPNEDMPQSIKDDIDDRLSKAGVFTYLSNLALVGGTNLLLFPKLFGLGHETSKLASEAIEKNLVKDAETGVEKEVYESATQRRVREGKSPHSLLDNIVTGLTKPVEESTKFGVQGSVSNTAREFWDRKNDEGAKKDTNDLLTTFAAQLAHTYTSKEGWNNIGMGMIIGALGAPGRGILAPLGEDSPLGKYGYKDVTDANGNVIGKEKLPSWQGGIAGSFQERAQEEAQVGKVVSDLNQHTNLFKAMKANYDTMVENNSLQKDQDKALKDNDIFNFQNAKDDQIHSYVSARIKNNLYDDLMDEINRTKKLSPDEFYTNFKGEDASNKATDFEKNKFQQQTISNFTERAKNTRDAIKTADDIYKGDNDDLRDHLIHSIAASKNLDLRERLINQSLADLSHGAVSNLNALGTSTIGDEIEHLRTNSDALTDEGKGRLEYLAKEGFNRSLTGEEYDMLSRFAETNPTAFALNSNKIADLLADSRKLRAKRQDYLDVYNKLYTQEGQKQFDKVQEDQKVAVQKAQDLEQEKKEDKQKEDIKKANIKETVAKAKDVTEAPEVVDQLTPEQVDNTPSKTGSVINLEDDFGSEGTKEAPGEEIFPETTTSTHEAEEVPVESNLTPEETAVVKIENNKELESSRDIITSDTGLVRNTSLEHAYQVAEGARLINLDKLRTTGNTIAYLGIDKVTYGKVNADRDVEAKTFDIFDDEGNIEINKFVDPKLLSQNHYTVGSKLELSVPSYSEMEERGLQDYSDIDYNLSIDDVDEFPIAIRGDNGKIIGYLPTRKNVANRVAEEFRFQALQDNAALREYIFENKDKSFKSSVTSRTPGWVITDKVERQKSIYDALGDKTKLADKVSLGIVKSLNKDLSANSNDLYTDNSGNPFSKGTVINGTKLQNGVVYAILPTSVEGSYVVHPTKINTIGINNARTIVEAIKLFANKDKLSAKEKQSVSNISEFNFKNFNDVSNFVNRIMYGSSKADASEDTIFKLYKDSLYLSNLDGSKKFKLSDIASNTAIQEEVAKILAERYFSVGVNNLNTKNPYISYSLDDDEIVQEKSNNSYQDYLNDQKAITSNVRGVHISGNEYAFTAQSVIGISGSVEKEATKLPEHTEAEVLPSSDELAEEAPQTEEAPIAPKKRMTTKKPNIDPSKLKGNSLEDINPIVDKFRNENEILAAPKIIKTLALPKVEALFKNHFLKGNKEKFYQEVTALGAGKEQTQILKDWIEENDPKTIDDLKVGIAAELSYTTEINTAKRTDYRDQNGWDELAETMDEEFVASIRGKEDKNSSYYSNMTVPGGTNYTENEISTPQIEPSIKGHAQFSTKNGIGWFRSDEKSVSQYIRGETDFDSMTDDQYREAEKDYIENKDKTSGIRRILEVQSDLFQKGRERSTLVEDQRDRQYAESADEAEELESRGYEFSGSTEDGLPSFTKANSKNQFLQLLNKDSNWVNFFVKSIIQDSARKGYEEVHFPTGNTASKVEGHTTLDEHKRNIEQNLNYTKETLDIFKSVLNDKPSSREGEGYKFYYYDKYPGIEGRTEEELKSSIESSIKGQEERLESWQKQYDDIETEGFNKLKPIWNFYENQVYNILKKNYTVEKVKDEHGNEWNKIKLEDTHKGQIYYDINPQKNFSVMNKLFVDLDKFSDSQQREVVDSIIYTIEEGKAEGYSTVEELFQYARDVFANGKDYLAELNDDGSFDPTIKKFDDIDENWDKFREKVLEKLKGLGIKVTKTFETNTSGEAKSEQDTPDLEVIDSDTPEDSFVSTEATYQKDFYLDSDQTSSKDTASAHLKLKLSLIPEVELIGDKLEPTTNFLGMGKMMDLNKVWTSLQGVLTGLEVDQIYPTIEELAKSNPMYSTILSNLRNDPSTNIQNEFVVAFSKQQTKPLTVKIGYADRTSRRTINVFGTNRQGANDILIDSWYDRFKNSGYVQEDATGELVVNAQKGKEAYDAFTRFMSTYNVKDLNLPKNLQRGLESIGINLSLPTIDNLVKNGTFVDRTKYSGKDFINKYIGLLYKRLAAGFTPKENLIGDTQEDDSTKLALNNPFISESKALTALAKLENITNPFLYESSYIGGDGRPRYSISNNTYLSKLFNRLNSDNGIDFIQEKLSTTYAANSIWGNKFLTDAKFRDNFSYHPVDSLGSNETNSPNKVFSRMNTKEKEFTRIALFQNKGRETSIFLAPIPSDKTTIPAIEAPKVKVVIDTDTYRITNSEALNALYTPFIAEYNRIREVQAQQEDPQFKDRLLQGYHFGMGEKFLVYDFLNKNKELFDSTGKLKIVDPQTLRDIITPEIQKFTTDLIKKQLIYWNKLGLFDKDSPLYDKTFKTKLGDFEDEKLLNRQFGADYAINQFLAHFNYTQLISGDPALHGKKTTDLTWINYNKRLAKDIAPGLDGNFTNTKYNTIFLKDLKYTSKQFNEYQAVLKKRSSAYKDLNPADAQEYTTLKEHLAVLEAYGKLTPILKAAGERLMAGGEDPFDVDLILQPMKPVYVGTVVDKSMGIDRMYYIKTSSFPLIPSVTKGLEIDKLRIAMETGNIDRAVYESGTKLGLPINNIVSTESKQGILRDDLDLKSNAIALDRNGFRLQQEVPYHAPSKDATANEGSQGRKLILSDVDNDDVLHLFDKDFTGKEAKQLYEDLHIEKMDRSFNKLLNDIGADKSGKIKDLSKLQKILLEEATSRNYNINDVYGLQVETVDGVQRFKIPLGFNNSSSRLESIMNSLFTNRVVKSELPGFSKIQGSSAGFSKLRTIDQLNSQVKDGIIWMDPKDTELNYIRKSEDGKTLLRADILLPNWFVGKDGKEIDLTKFIKEDGTLDTDKLPENLLTTIGIRIPTQGYNSMMSFRVKGFLPKSVGDLAIVPADIVAQMGSDFDVDKLFMYRYHYNFDGDKLTKINPDINKQLSEFSNEEIDNSIVQYYEDRYKDVSLLPKILEPNGYGDLPTLAKDIADLQKLDSDNHFFSTIKQNEFHKNNNDGIAGRGIFSLFSTFVRAAQDAQLKLPTAVVFKVGDKTVRSTSLYGKGHIENKSPLTVIQYLQSASVDNAKEQLLGYLNINPITMDVAGTIAMAGFDENLIGYFLSQPILREYVDMLSNSNDITNPVFKSNTQREAEVLQKLIGKYAADEDQLKEERVFSANDLRNELKETSNLAQRKILEQYLSIKDSAKQIRMLQNAITTDTNGLGVRYVDLQVKENNINIAKYGSQIVNANKLFEGTQIGRASEMVSEALRIYSNILPYNTEAYKYAVNNILQDMGRADKSDINARDLKSIYDTAKSYIYSDKKLLGIDDVNVERNRLEFGSNALGNRWEAYTKTPAGKKNLLSERILVRRGNTKGDPIRLEALNTPAANSSDNSEAMAAYYRMYYKGTDEEKELAKDIVNYFVLTGAKQGPNSIARYIPYDVLEAHDLSSKLHAIDKGLREGSDDILAGTHEQFFQHNPSKAIAFDVKDHQIHSYKKEGFLLEAKSTYQVSDSRGNLVPPTYMSVYSRADKDFLLYKIAESTPTGNRYSRIDLLGDKGLDEYNANVIAQYSLIKGNQVNLPIPENINKKVEENTDTDKTLITPTRELETEAINKEFLTDHFNLDKSDDPEMILNSIAMSGNSEYADIAGDLKRLLVNYPNLKIDSNESRESVSGAYYSDSNTISINLDNILAISKDAIADTSRVVLHELLHAITANKINDYKNLSPENKKNVDKLKILMNQYDRIMDQDELEKFEDLTSRLSKDTFVSNEDRQWYIENKSKYYPLTNLHEFIAAGLTDPNFRQQLKDNNFWSKLWKVISDLLGLNESYKNDYEALYNTALDLGGRDKSTEKEEEKTPERATTKFEEEQSTGYKERTIKNASADATIALATDFTSAGERLTKSSVIKQNKKYIPVDANRLEITPERVNGIVNQLNKSKQGDLFNEITLNIAGNGIYTMKGKYTQKQVDDFTYNLLKAVIDSPNLQVKIGSIRSGGQTGFDEAGIKAARRLGIPSNVLAPKGWKYRDINGVDRSDEEEFKSRFNEPLNDLSPRDQKKEFLSKYHLYDGKPITVQNFDRINSSVKANDKYSNIKLDLAWENGERVLRVFTRGGTPLYDINPEIKPEKSKEEKIVDKSLKRLYDIRNKFQSNPNFNKNVSLQAKVEAIDEQIRQIKEQKTVSIITSQAKDKLSSIQSLMDRPGLMSAYDIEETKRYLSWYANIRDYVNYNEAFEEENKNLDEIVRKSLALNTELDKKKLETFNSYVGSELDIKADVNKIFTSPNIDVGVMESTFESGMYSSNQKLQVLQSLIRKSQLKINDDFNKYQDEVVPIFKEFQKKYNNYDMILQLDKEGKKTGRLLNKYQQEFYEKKKYGKDDFKVEITEKNKEAFEEDLKTLIEDLPDWNKEGTHDYAKYNQWFMSHDPEQHLAKVKKGMWISKEERDKFKEYVTRTPSDKWLDPRYKALKKFGENSVEMKVYNELEKQFRSMSRLYDNEANYIPEVKKDFLDRVMHSDWKGAFGQLTKDMQDAVTTRVQPVVNSNSLDINGVPSEAIPVYMMSNLMNPADKSYDLGRVLMFAKLQDFMLTHKNTVEPYLQMGKELALAQPQLTTNTSGEQQLDEDGNVLLNHSPGRSPNLTAQANYMLDSYLYDKTVEHAGASKSARITRQGLNNKGEVTTETRALTGSKVVDAVSAYTRLKALGLNPVSSVGRVIWGVISNTIYAGDRKAYGEREAIKSLRTILNASIPGTDSHNKVHALAEYFDMRQQLGEIKFGKFKLNSINNPLAEATPYVLVNKTEDFIQHQTGIAVLMKQKLADLNGNQRDLYDAFDNKGKWKTDEFGPNPYDNDKERLNLSSYIQSVVTAVHGDYGDATLASKNYVLRNLLVMRKWLPRSMAIRFGGEYTDLQGNTQKGRYRSYELAHINPLNLIKDMYKAFTIDPTEDNIDARNLRMNAYELAFIPILWGAALGLKALIHGIYHDDDEEKAAMTFLLNSTTRVSGDLTFFFNPYSFQSTIREPIPAFKTIMDFYDLGPAVLQTIEGKGTYKTGIHKGQSKIAVKLMKAVPLINQPEKVYSAIKQELIDR